jgi:hypothetical protein
MDIPQCIKYHILKLDIFAPQHQENRVTGASAGKAEAVLDRAHGQQALTLKATLCIVVFALIYDRRDADIAGKYETRPGVDTASSCISL